MISTACFYYYLVSILQIPTDCGTTVAIVIISKGIMKLFNQRYNYLIETKSGGMRDELYTSEIRQLNSVVFNTNERDNISRYYLDRFPV